MAPWRQISVLLASALALSGCALVVPLAIVVGVAQDGATKRAPLPTVSATPVSGPLAAFYNQTVVWKNCGDAECATVKVPVDYERPDGETVDLAVTRVPATGNAIGSLFVNPGGPGGSAVDYARAADQIVTGPVREAYDIIGVDPRGVAKSDPIHCLTDKQIDDFMAADGTPDTPQEEQQVIDLSAEVGILCDHIASRLYAHMGTLDAARDLDIVRQLVGDDSFNYLGKSYGSMLGQTYAQLFPERVGRVVLDGDLPASLDLVTISKDQAVAFEASLRNFVEDCLTTSDCPLTGTTDEAVAQLRNWIQSLDSDPIAMGDRLMNEPIAMYAILSYLYFPPYDYDQLRPALADAMNNRNAGPLFDLLDQRISRSPDGRYLDNSTDAFYAVTCLDRPYTGTVEQAKQYAKDWASIAPTFGPGVAWGLLACKDWPATSPVLTSEPTTANPILVVSTKHDPATPYQWGVQMSKELPGSVLLSYDGWGHTAYTQGSDCIDSAVDAYLLSGTLPAEGTLCS